MEMDWYVIKRNALSRERGSVIEYTVYTFYKSINNVQAGYYENNFSLS